MEEEGFRRVPMSPNIPSKGTLEYGALKGYFRVLEQGPSGYL